MEQTLGRRTGGTVNGPRDPRQTVEASFLSPSTVSYQGSFETSPAGRRRVGPRRGRLRCSAAAAQPIYPVEADASRRS